MNGATSVLRELKSLHVGMSREADVSENNLNVWGEMVARHRNGATESLQKASKEITQSRELCG